MRPSRRVAAFAGAALLSIGGCGGDDGSTPADVAGPTGSVGSVDAVDEVDEVDGEATDWTGDVRRAVEAVEAARGEGQEYFEVTATPQLTNVFVAVDDATAALPYVFVDGELEGPGPRLDGASGFTFPAAAVDVEPGVLDGVAAELSDVAILALSVEGVAGGFVRYVVSAQSSQGGALDIEITRTGAIVAVDPL